ncbi:MAG: CarD family transcriptional regulator [Clostridia bacterium]|nr:CarD family transcriptional regulator [Clostridia bacterium]
MSYKVGDTVLYGSDGVCHIDEISERKIGSEKLSYYVLKPIYDAKSTVFVPMQNQKLLAKMVDILSEAELLASLAEAKQSPFEWTEDDGQRKEIFKEIIDSGCIADIIRVVRLLYIRKKELVACGRKLRVTDEIILKECEKILYDEFALVLSIERESVPAFLNEKLEIY